VADLFTIFFTLLQFDATDEELSLLHFDFTYLNFCCRLILRETPSKWYQYMSRSFW